jgi:cell division septum initiation protein DivIVA
MPDENSAATEHSIIQEVTAPLATMPDNPVPAVADVEFPIALRGYDRLAVDAYVKRTSQLVAELHATRSPEAAVRRALERVGEEISGILQRSHEAAAQITAQSRTEADDRLERARREADDITEGARRQLKDLDVETDRIWAERQRIVEDAQDLARQLLALAQAAAERFPPAEEPASERPDQPAAGEARDDEPERPVFGGEPGAGEPGQGDESTVQDNEPAPPDGATEHPTEPFDGEATVIMPPIKPDEDQQT